MESTVSADELQDDNCAWLLSMPISPSYGPPSLPSDLTLKNLSELEARSQSLTTQNDRMFSKDEDGDETMVYDSPKKQPVVQSQRDVGERSKGPHLDIQRPNPDQPRYPYSVPPNVGWVAWWCKTLGKGAIVERGDRMHGTLDIMVPVKLSDIKPSYGALCPGSYVTYHKWNGGLYNFWVVGGYPYVLYEEATDDLKEYSYLREEQYKSALEWLEYQDENYDRATFLAYWEKRRNPYLKD